MFCSKCGTKNDDNTKFCTNCGQPMASTPVVVPVQPVGVVTGEKVNSNLALAIVSIFVGFWPVSIASIIYSSKVATLVAAGNVEEAKKSAATSKTISIWNISIALVIYGIFFAIGFMAGVRGSL